MSVASWLVALSVALAGPPSAAPPGPYTLVTPRELATRLAHGPKWLIGDVRSRAAYDRRHVRGAVSLPHKDLSSWGPRLPRGQGIALYCT